MFRDITNKRSDEFKSLTGEGINVSYKLHYFTRESFSDISTSVDLVKLHGSYPCMVDELNLKGRR